jgi:predicted transcriptional regulator
MKKVAITLLCLTPIISFAQNPMGMSEADMQNMMQKMQGAQACMEKIDRSELDALEKKAKKFQAEMKSLCASGKRDAAQEKAMVYMKEIVNSSAVKETMRCGKMMEGAMQGMMQGMMQNTPLMNQEKDYSSQHVCDSGI